MGRWWGEADEDRKVINVNTHGVGYGGSTVDAWFDTAGNNWQNSFGGAGIVYSSDSDGYPHYQANSIGWKGSKMSDTDNLYLWNENGHAAVITDVRPNGDNFVPKRNITDFDIPGGYVNHYHLKKGDKPVTRTGDIEEFVNVNYDKHMSGSHYGFLLDDYKNYNYVKLEGDTDSNKAKPCPGTIRAGFSAPKKIKCLYNHNEIKKMVEAENEYSSSNARMELKNKVVKKFCAKPENATKDIGGGLTCITQDTTGSVGTNHCRLGENIKKPECKNIPNHSTLFEEFCDANPKDSKCSCYNVYNFEKKCKDKPTNAGCAEANTSFELLKDLGIPEAEAMNSLSCSSKACADDKYRPANWESSDKTCDKQLEACDPGVTYRNATAFNLDQMCEFEDATSDVRKMLLERLKSGEFKVPPIEKDRDEDEDEDDDGDSKSATPSSLGSGGRVAGVSIVIIILIIIAALII